MPSESLLSVQQEALRSDKLLHHSLNDGAVVEAIADALEKQAGWCAAASCTDCAASCTTTKEKVLADGVGAQTKICLQL